MDNSNRSIRKRNIDSGLVFLILPLIAFIGLFDFFGTFFGWYETIWWYDIPMHILGGAWVACLIFYLQDRFQSTSLKMSFLWIFGIVLVVGILWEVYEYGVDMLIFKKYDISTIPRIIVLDSAADLVNDIIGFFIAWRLVGKKMVAGRTLRAILKVSRP